MGLFSKDIRSMEDLYLHTLQDIYHAENQILKALPKMIEKAGSAALREGFETHMAETREQVTRLERAFESLGEMPQGTTCPAIDGIIDEANEIAGDVEDQNVLDAALAAAAQAVEHYEITRYGTLIAWSKELGHDDCVRLFEQTLEEERAADKKLTDLAERRLNRAA